MQHVRTWHLAQTDRRFADLGPIEHLFFLPRERRIMTSIIPRKLGRGKSPPRNNIITAAAVGLGGIFGSGEKSVDRLVI